MLDIDDEMPAWSLSDKGETEETDSLSERFNEHTYQKVKTESSLLNLSYCTRICTYYLKRNSIELPLKITVTVLFITWHKPKSLVFLLK